MTIECPDGAVCTHSCDRRVVPGPQCWRIRNNEPPTPGVYPDDQWPTARAAPSTQLLRIALTDVPASAAVDALLAIEQFAGRVYRQRAEDPAQQAAYNRLAAIVLPLRESVDGLRPQDPADPLRVLLADEDAAAELVARATLGETTWEAIRTSPLWVAWRESSIDKARAVVRALRKVDEG